MELNGPDLKWPAVLVTGVVVALLLAYGVHRWMARRSARASAAVANSTALTELPEYRRALKLHRIRTAVLALSAVLLGGAALVGAARPLDTTIDKPQTRSRDIMLCLDISGSMAAYDATLVSTFRTLVKSFQGERIGLVIFNSSAATVFPLTDDYDFINDELDTASSALSGDPQSESFFAGTFNGRGTSLIGDGLATCASSFDKVDTQRARSVVFATDNHLAGRPIVDVEQAAELAKAKGVRVYGLNPEQDGPDEEAVQMRELVTGTGGQYYAMTDQAAIRGIVDSVQAQETTLIDGAARSLHSDNPNLPIALAGVGLLGVIGASRRWAW
ncbi:VWA domain-containing protein [Terrabacter terrae]|uniref:VWA domain-containing protein n=1 Tax=Terrabacter terrae TaxID=318434 RepID=A0ABN2UJH1_9MICO